MSSYCFIPEYYVSSPTRSLKMEAK